MLGGFSFALNNVMLRREAHRPEAARALAMFLGGAVVAGVLALALGERGAVPWPPAPAPGWMLGALAMGAAFLLGNLALQYGAARLPANVTAVVMVTEVLFASVSAVLLGAGQADAAAAGGRRADRRRHAAGGALSATPRTALQLMLVGAPAVLDGDGGCTPCWRSRRWIMLSSSGLPT